MIKKIIIGILVLGFLVTVTPAQASILSSLKAQLRSLQHEVSGLRKTQGADAFTPVTNFTNAASTSTGDTTPRIAYWWGKVNQHIDAQGNWQTDADGSSGANIDKLAYCKKFYSNTAFVEDYKSETLISWRDAGNTGGPYTLAITTTKCVPSTTPLVTGTVTVPPQALSVDLKINGSDTPGPVPLNSMVTVSWTSTGATNCVASGANAPLWQNSRAWTTNHGEPTSGQYDIQVYAPSVVLGMSCSDASDHMVSDKVSIVGIVPTLDTTSRIMYWYGKVNQHVDTEGNWQTDSDGTSGADLDKLTYCKKFYPKTTSVTPYKSESIGTWHEAGNLNNWPETKTSDQCIQGTTNAPNNLPYVDYIQSVKTPVRAKDTLYVSDVDTNVKVFVYGGNLSSINLVLISDPTQPLNQYGLNNGGMFVAFTAISDTYGYFISPGFISSSISSNFSKGGKFNFQIEKFDGTLYGTSLNSKLGVTVVTDSTPTTPQVTIISPNGGEKFDYLKPITISWKGGKNKVKVGLMGPDKYSSVNAASLLGWIDVNAKPDSSIVWDGQSLKDAAGNWPIPAQTAVAPGIYRIVTVSENEAGNYVIENNGSQIGSEKGNNDRSDGYFTIEGLHPNDPISTAPSITVLSPNGGETYSPGQKINVTWKSENLPKDNKVRISLQGQAHFGGSGLDAVVLVGSSINDGQEVVTLPSSGPDLRGDGFVINVEALDLVYVSTTKIGFDSSDNTFTISQAKKPDVVVDPTPSQNSCDEVTFKKTLRVGSRGDEVESLQTILNDKGYLDDSGVSGSFGAKTKIALKQFQRAMGVSATGTTGPATRAKLNEVWTTQCNADQTQG